MAFLIRHERNNLAINGFAISYSAIVNMKRTTLQLWVELFLAFCSPSPSCLALQFSLDLPLMGFSQSAHVF